MCGLYVCACIVVLKKNVWYVSNLTVYFVFWPECTESGSWFLLFCAGVIGPGANLASGTLPVCILQETTWNGHIL